MGTHIHCSSVAATKSYCIKFFYLHSLEFVDGKMLLVEEFQDPLMKTASKILQFLFVALGSVDDLNLVTLDFSKESLLSPCEHQRGDRLARI